MAVICKHGDSRRRPLSGRLRRSLIALALVCATIPALTAARPAHAQKSWDGGAGTAFWDDPANWSVDTLPGLLDDVLNAIGATINHRTGTDTVNSLTTNGQLIISGGSTLSVNGALTFNPGGSLLLNNGTLANATVSDPTLLSFSVNTTNILSNVTLAGGVGLKFADTTEPHSNTYTVRIANGITNSPGAIYTIGGGSNSHGILAFDGSQTFDNAVVHLALNGSLLAGAGATAKTLTLGSNLVVQGGGTVGGSLLGSNDASLVNNGTLSSGIGATNIMNVQTTGTGTLTNNGTMQSTMKDANSTGTLEVHAGTGGLTNNGIIRATSGGLVRIFGTTNTLGNIVADGAGSRVDLHTALTPGQLGGISITNGGNVNFSDTLNNTGNTLDVQNFVGAGSANGSLGLFGGRIVGGTINHPELMRFIANFSGPLNILENVTLGGNTLNVISGNSFSGSVCLSGTPLPFGATVNLGDANTNGNILFDIPDGTTLTLANATIRSFVGFTSSSVGVARGGQTSPKNVTLALDPSLTLTGPSFTIGTATGTPNNITIQNGATLISNAGNTWVVTGDNVVNTATGVMRASGANSEIFVAAPLSNSGTLEATGGGQIVFQPFPAAILTNTGTINIGAGSQMTVAGGASTGITQTAGMTTVNGTMALQGTGTTFTLAGGTLGGSGTISGGPVNNTGGTVAPGASVGTAGTLALGAGYSQGAGGTMQMDLGGLVSGQWDVLAVTGGISLGGTLSLDLINGFAPSTDQTFTLLTSTTGITGNFATVNLLTPGFTFATDIVGNEYRVTLHPVANATAQWTGNGGDGLWSNANNWSTTPNLPGATDDAANTTGQAINHATGTDTVQSLAVNGPLTISGGSTLNVTSFLSFNAGGSLTLNNGTLGNATVADPTLLLFSNDSGNMLSGVTLGGPTFNVSSGSNPGQVRLRNTTLSGGVTLNIGTNAVGGTLAFDIADSVTQNINNATVNFGTSAGTGKLAFGLSPTGAAQQNTTLALATGLTLTGKNAAIGEVASPVTNSTVSNAATLTSDEGGSWMVTADNVSNASTGTIEASAANSSFTVNGALSNAGVIRAANSATASVTLASGVVTNLAGGQITALGGGTVSHTTGETFTNAGTITVGTGSQLTLGAGGITQTAGTTTLNGTVVLQNGGAFNLAGGTLSGTGIITGGNLINTGGVVSPGNSPGTLSLVGDYSQSGAGNLLIEIGGPNAADFDHLFVNGNITVGGTLTITRLNGFLPADGQTFDFLVATGGISGQFDRINVLGFTSVVFDFTQSGGTGTLTFHQVTAPEPGALALLLIGGCGVIARGRQRRYDG